MPVKDENFNDEYEEDEEEDLSIYDDEMDFPFQED